MLSSSWFNSDEMHELGGDVGETVADQLGDSTLGLTLGGNRFSFRFNFVSLPTCCRCLVGGGVKVNSLTLFDLGS